MARKLSGIRKHLLDLDRALHIASTLANSAPDGSRTVRVYGRVMKDGSERYCVLDRSEKPAAGYQVLYEVKRVGE